MDKKNCDNGQWNAIHQEKRAERKQDGEGVGN